MGTGLFQGSTVLQQLAWALSGWGWLVLLVPAQGSLWVFPTSSHSANTCTIGWLCVCVSIFHLYEHLFCLNVLPCDSTPYVSWAPAPCNLARISSWVGGWMNFLLCFQTRYASKTRNHLTCWLSSTLAWPSNSSTTSETGKNKKEKFSDGANT